MSSPFSLERAEFLCEKLKLNEIKVASSKMTNKKLLKYLNNKTKKVFLSTGMSNIKEINQSLKYLDNTEVIIMHCVSEYPLKPKNSNLLAITQLKKEFPKFTIGYSDHCIGNLAVEIAVSLGATVIEKHFTLDKNYKGTDHILSADFKDLKKLRKDIDLISLMLGSEIKKPSKKDTYKSKDHLTKLFLTFQNSRPENKTKVNKNKPVIPDNAVYKYIEAKFDFTESTIKNVKHHHNIAMDAENKIGYFLEEYIYKNKKRIIGFGVLGAF